MFAFLARRVIRSTHTGSSSTEWTSPQRRSNHSVDIPAPHSKTVLQPLNRRAMKRMAGQVTHGRAGRTPKALRASDVAKATKQSRPSPGDRRAKSPFWVWNRERRNAGSSPATSRT